MSDGIPTSAVTTRTITATFCHASEALEFATIGSQMFALAQGWQGIRVTRLVSEFSKLDSNYCLFEFAG